MTKQQAQLFKEIALDRIAPDAEQPRREFQEEELAELADSIAQHGLLQPILVRPNDPTCDPLDDAQTYTIIAGERRYRATKRTGSKTISAIISARDDYRTLALVENLQRQDLNKLEEARAIAELMRYSHYTHEQVAQVLGKSRPYVTNVLRLLNLDTAEQNALLGGKISEAHARVLAGIKEEQARAQLLEQMLHKRLSVRDAEQYSKKLKKRQDIFIRRALEELEDMADNKVYVKARRKESGTLCIDYSTPKDLELLLEILYDGLAARRER